VPDSAPWMVPDDGTTMVRSIQQIAQDSIKYSMPAGVVYGGVTRVKPLEIRLGKDANGMPVREDQIILTNAVRDYHVFLEAYDNEKAYDNGGAGYHVIEVQNQNHRHPFANAGGPGITDTQILETDHDHNYKGGVFKVKLGLKQGEKVLLLQVQGGQHWVVLDRVDPPKGEEGSD